MNKIAFVINTYYPKLEDIQKCIQNTDLFDEKIIYFNKETREFKDNSLPNFRIYGDGQNLSAADGFNFAIQQVRSEWICPFCIDDWIDPLIMEKLIVDIHNDKYKDYDVIKCPCYCGNNIMKWKIIGQEKYNYEELKNNIKQKNCISFSSIYRKKVWLEIGGYKNEPFNDWGFWLRVIKAKYPIFNYPLPTYYWQIHNNQLYKKELDLHGFENIKKQLLQSVGEF